jgi:Protein of unknown function (DUF3558)
VIGRWLALVPTVALCAACTSAVGGVPNPDSSEPRLPARPRVLSIAEIDPCGTLTGTQLTSLGLARYGARKPEGSRGASCDWDHYPTEPIENYSLDINTSGGVEMVFGRPQLQVTTVAGFGAVQTPAPYGASEQNCVVNVDVAPSQAVQVAYFYNGQTVPMTHEIACQKARRAAEMAMQTILTRTG